MESLLFDMKIQQSIERLQYFAEVAQKIHPEGYYLAFSGGKDSQTVYHLAKEAGVPFQAYYNRTTVDPPELIHFLFGHYPDVKVNEPKETMWRLIERRGVPTRGMRFCCKELKEHNGDGRFVVTGVRWAESINRSKRAMVELNQRKVSEIRIGSRQASREEVMLSNDNDDRRKLNEYCMNKNTHVLNPIVDWTEEDVWLYLNGRGIPHCSLYDEGWKRIGCIGCPLNDESQVRELERWPKYKAAYLRAFSRFIEKGRARGRRILWNTAEEIMEWWTRAPEEVEKEMKLAGFEGEEEE